MPSTDPSLQAKLDNLLDQIKDTYKGTIDVVVSVDDATGGATATSLSAKVYDQYGHRVRKVCEFVITAGTAEFLGGNANITLDTFVNGTVVKAAAAAGWWLVRTDADGALDCNANNAVDEQVWFAATGPPAGVSDIDYGVCVRGCVPNDATWSA
jgi:hypothetical protein